jgi:hypothetical protein
MTLEERQALTRSIPADLAPDDVVVRHGNAMQGPSAECWYVSVRGSAVPGFYFPDVAARLRLQILAVAEAKTAYQAATTSTGSCVACGEPCGFVIACEPCISAYQLQ